MPKPKTFADCKTDEEKAEHLANHNGAMRKITESGRSSKIRYLGDIELPEHIHQDVQRRIEQAEEELEKRRESR